MRLRSNSANAPNIEKHSLPLGVVVTPPLFGLVDTRLWGRLLIIAAAVLTIWSMVYYLRKALPEIRAKAR